MENTHITKKNPTYIEIKQSCFIYLCNRICECHPKSGTRLALDISLYVIDNSLIGNKQQLLISGRKNYSSQNLPRLMSNARLITVI